MTTPHNDGHHGDSVEQTERCWKCDGSGCEEGCGYRGGCTMVHAGPQSHRICALCGGRGRTVVDTRECWHGPECSGTGPDCDPATNGRPDDG